MCLLARKQLPSSQETRFLAFIVFYQIFLIKCKFWTIFPKKVQILTIFSQRSVNLENFFIKKWKFGQLQVENRGKLFDPSWINFFSQNINLWPAPKVMLTNHNSDYLDLVSNCNTVSTTTQHSFGIFFNSIQSFGNFIKSSGCLNFTKNNIFEGFMYSKLSFSNSIPNFIILNIPIPNYISTTLTVYASSFIISFGS